MDQLPSAIQERCGFAPKLVVHETVFKMDYQAADAGGLEQLCRHISEQLQSASRPQRLPQSYWNAFNAVVECAEEKIKQRQIPKVSKDEFAEVLRRNKLDPQLDLQSVTDTLESYGLIKSLRGDGQLLVEPISWLTMVSVVAEVKAVVGRLKNRKGCIGPYHKHSKR